MLNLTPLILLLPLVGFVVVGLFGRRMPKGAISLIACGLVLASFVAAVVDFFALLGEPVGQRSGDVAIWTWLNSGALTIKFGLLSDPLSAIMLLIVTGVGFLIHVYSIGYMADDASYWRFFSYLNLFEFAMILLVAADNFLFLLIGWGGVGLASFLLIGFWYTRPSAVAAAKNAFVVNVIGDFGLMIAIFLLFKYFGSLAYANTLVARPAVSGGVLTAIALLLFLAAAAKSAQLPLHVWLPDAMEGPTPVSALIHAATMVTAGVYLVARAAPLFTAAPHALGIVGGVTGLTALFAATIACVQKDIKRVLAYSTMSQIGYMFMGESAGGFSTGIFHLTTHAYFKALLFMCAGAVIHALGGEQDMTKMGGLRRKLPLTFWCFVVSGLALAAIFPFAGFWSKDAILGILLAKATANGGQLGWWLLYGSGLLTAILTGFYTFRLIFGVFLHEYRGPEIATAHATHETAAHHARGATGQRAASTRRDPLANVHDVGPAMAVPMVILAILSVIGGFDGTPFNNAIGNFLQPVTGRAPEFSPSNGLFWVGIAAGLAAGLLGIAIAWGRYGRRKPAFSAKA
ncbi:MAG TPA: NADH-quinone oxidoreductase subunit L, partial [Ktedonobacterales bacterium]|nr:NADH-quinone oxidoreductase subunit L [Ktedonobacterales bacterium]